MFPVHVRNVETHVIHLVMPVLFSEVVLRCAVGTGHVDISNVTSGSSGIRSVETHVMHRVMVSLILYDFSSVSFSHKAKSQVMHLAT